MVFASIGSEVCARGDSPCLRRAENEVGTMRRQFAPAGVATSHLLDRLWFVGIHVVMFALLMLSASQAHASSRIKDIAQFEGVRDNTLVGYGLVTGLRNTGDDIKKIAPTKESLIGMLE